MALQLSTFEKRRGYAEQMQPIAVSRIYRRLWPSATIHQGDIEPDALSVALDRVGNTDKTIITQYSVIHVAQRIRQAEVWEDTPQYRDFTIREAEYVRLCDAAQNGGVLPGFYAYGYATRTWDDFIRFFVLRFPDWFRYARSPMTPPAHRLRFKDNRGRQENFYFVAWHNIPDQFLALKYMVGMAEEIQPIKQGSAAVEQLWLFTP